MPNHGYRVPHISPTNSELLCHATPLGALRPLSSKIGSARPVLLRSTSARRPAQVTDSLQVQEMQNFLPRPASGVTAPENAAKSAFLRRCEAAAAVVQSLQKLDIGLKSRTKPIQ